MKVPIGETLQEQLNKLPKWVQHHFDTQEREITLLKEKIALLETERNVGNLESSPDEPIITWENLMDGEHRLPPQCYVKVYLPGEKRRKWIAFHWRKDDSVLDVSCSRVLIVKPRASNNIRLEVDEF